MTFCWAAAGDTQDSPRGRGMSKLSPLGDIDACPDESEVVQAAGGSLVKDMSMVASLAGDADTVSEQTDGGAGKS